MTDLPPPPIAERRPHTSPHHGIALDDPYAWLRDPGYPEVKDPDVLAYLNAYKQMVTQLGGLPANPSAAAPRASR